MKQPHQTDRNKRAERIMLGYNLFRLSIVIVFSIIIMYLMNK